MKVLDLRCQSDHAFEGWFGGEADFQDQLQRGLLQCPLCGSAQVRKVLSAPRIQRSGGQGRADATEAAMPAKLGEGAGDRSSGAVAETGAGSSPPTAALQAAWLHWARKVVAQTEDVGPLFAEEARRMHHGEVAERAIRGQASAREALQLLDEGIAVLPLPLPAAVNETLQ